MTSTLVQNNRLLVPKSMINELYNNESFYYSLSSSTDDILIFDITQHDGEVLVDMKRGEHVVSIDIPSSLHKGFNQHAGKPFDIKFDGSKIVFERLDETEASQVKEGEDQYGIAIPPGWIRQRYVGQNDKNSFLNSGGSVANTLLKFSRFVNNNIDTDSNILDFGCGCGRVSRHFYANKYINTYGVDIDHVGINWAKAYLSENLYKLSQEWPKLPFEDNKFDLVYAISVFTHLDEEHQYAWLEELSRIMKTNGVLVATFRGNTCVRRQVTNTNEQEVIINDMNRCGISFRETKIWKGIFPEYYHGTYHSYQYILDEWGKHFYIKTIIPAGEMGIGQDAALLVPK